MARPLTRASSSSLAAGSQWAACSWHSRQLERGSMPTDPSAAKTSGPPPSNAALAKTQLQHAPLVTAHLSALDGPPVRETVTGPGDHVSRFIPALPDYSRSKFWQPPAPALTCTTKWDCGAPRGAAALRPTSPVSGFTSHLRSPADRLAAAATVAAAAAEVTMSAAAAAAVVTMSAAAAVAAATATMMLDERRCAVPCGASRAACMLPSVLSDVCARVAACCARAQRKDDSLHQAT